MAATSCIFCKIVAGDIPATRVYEDERTLAFLDIGPVAHGHTLIIPKTHAETVAESSVEDLQAVAAVLPRICRAVREATACEGFNVICNNGSAAGQVVPHVHFHVIPRRQGDGIASHWPAGEYPEGAMDVMAAKIKSCLCDS